MRSRGENDYLPSCSIFMGGVILAIAVDVSFFCNENDDDTIFLPLAVNKNNQ